MSSLKFKITLSSCILFAITFSLAFFISDHTSLVFKTIMGVSSLVIFALTSALGGGIAYATATTCYELYTSIINLLFHSEKTFPHKKLFFKKYFYFFTAFTLLILLKFSTDFIFEQLIAAYLFLAGSIGLFNGSLIVSFINAKKPKTFYIIK